MLHVIEVGERAYPVAEAGMGRHFLHPFALHIQRGWLVPQSRDVFSPCPGGHRRFSSTCGAALARLCRCREGAPLSWCPSAHAVAGGAATFTPPPGRPAAETPASPPGRSA